MMFDPGLFHDRIRRMTASDFAVDGKSAVIDGTAPNIVIAIAVPHKNAAVFLQNGADEFFILGHYTHTPAYRSR